MNPNLLVVRILISLFLVITFAPSGNSAEPKLINVGWTGGSAWTALPFQVALDKGFFEKEGFKVRLITMRGTTLMLSALMAGEVDYVTILPFIAGAAMRGLPVKIVASVAKSSGYAIVSKPEIGSLEGLKGKRIAINSFGSSADFAIYSALSRSGLDPNKDVTLQTISGSPDARFAALVSGAVDATVLNSPFEYWAEEKGFKTLVSVPQMAEFVRIPIVGVSTSQVKIQKEPDEIVRFLRAVRAGILFIQSEREVGVGLMEKTLRLDRTAAERFYVLYREQYNPELTAPQSVVKEWIAVGTFRDKEKKGKVDEQKVHDWTFAERGKR
ncbi:MAG TPA: ABC transporter substrate-binding protein [Candidatus Binatia bacterium]|nr:ABC transporter substrate-binding protein [Candidatus Binatia bacterium]